jgi:hypothetical protein
MPQNGDVNKRFGLYRNLCCGQEVIIREGGTFPDCKNHPKLTTVWKSVDLEKNAAMAKAKKWRRIV